MGAGWFRVCLIFLPQINLKKVPFTEIGLVPEENQVANQMFRQLFFLLAT
jgi:hypothetical protein